MKPSAAQPAAPPELLEPFADSVKNVFTVMLDSSLELELDDTPAADVPPEGVSSAAVVGLKGTEYWTLVLTIPEETGLRITQRFLQADDVSSEDVSDALGELANMVGGGAKTCLAQSRGEDISMTLPTVVTGSDYRLESVANEAAVAICRTSLGEFSMKVTRRAAS